MNLWLGLYGFALVAGLTCPAYMWLRADSDPRLLKLIEPWKTNLGIAPFLATHSVFPVFWGAWGVLGGLYEPAQPYAITVMSVVFLATSIYLLITYYSHRASASVGVLKQLKRARNTGVFLALFGLMHGWSAWFVLWL